MDAGLEARKFKVIQVILLAGVLPWLITLGVNFLLGSQRRVHEPLHESLEVTGACIALAVAMLLWLRAEHEEGARHLLWVAGSLVAMGLVDGAHGIAPFGLAWSWLRHSATLAGGLMFALVWLRTPAFFIRRKRFFMLAVVVMAIAWSLTIWWRPELMPAPWGPGGYTFAARSANAIGGLGFMAAAWFFMRRYLRKPQMEELVFASHTLLFGTASLLFGFSHLWAAAWWAWHVFRLLAYVVVLAAAYEIVITLYQRIASHAQELEARVQARTAELRRVAAIVESSNDAIIAKTLDGIVTSWNPGAEKIYGYPAQEIVGRSVTVVVPADRVAELHTIMQKIARGEQVRHYETVRVRKDRQTIHVSLSVSPLKDEKGQIIGASTVARDVTERKQAEEQARKASLYTRSLIEASLDPLVTISKDGKIMDVNRATELATGLTREQLIGTDFSDYFTDPVNARCGYERVFAEESVRDYPLVLRHTSGSVMEVLYNASVFRNERGEVEGVFAAARDVTARRKSEQALNRSEKRYRSLVTATSQIVWTTNAQGEVVEDMPSWRAFTGMTVEQMLGSGWINSLNPEDRKQTAEIWAKAVQERSLYETEYRIRRKDGEYRMVVARGAPVVESDGRISEWVGTCTDVTERKQGEQELRLSRERLALAQKAAHSGTFDWDIQNNLNVWTPEIEEVHGLRPGEFAGKYEDWEALVLPGDLPAAKAAIQKSLKTGQFAGEWRIRRRDDGQIRWITARAKVIFDESGKPARMLGLNMDVTERKQAEEEVRRLNEQLEERVRQRTAELEAANKELEAFTYSVSHDLRAPLRHISGFSKILTEEYGSALPSDAQHQLQRIQEGTRRMGLLVDDLLNLGRVGRSELRLQVAGLNSVVDEVVSELKKECEGREIEWRIGNLPYIECDPSLMRQVFQNLLSNAVKFTRPRSKATIEVGQKEQDSKPVVFVRDNGVGFSMKYSDKLFGVFQRLHRQEDFEGTGVGLATVQRIIHKHGGRIWAESELEKGATFYFTLGNSEKSEFKVKTAGMGS